MDVSSQSLEDFADDFTAARNSHTVDDDAGDFLVNVGGGEEQLAAQEEGELVGLAATFSPCENLDDILGESFSGERHESISIGKIDDDDKISHALSEQFDEYLLQFNQVNHQPFGIEDDLNENFDNLFPGLGFD